MQTTPIGIYIHIPFCAVKCNYCDFYSEKCSKSSIDKYVTAVCSSITDNYGKTINTKVNSVYLGGGTPSVIGTKPIVDILTAVKTSFDLTSDCEITIEVNPKTGGRLDYLLLKKLGVNRISMGVQSSNSEELKILGRNHTNAHVEKAVSAAKNAGIENISVDLMICTPCQTLESLDNSIDFCVSLQPKHISGYMLKIEEGTRFFEQKEQLNLPKEDDQIKLYNRMCQRLKKCGFEQYEISNFAKKGFQSRHNLKYWNDEEYFGIGAGAHSFIDGKRFYCSRSMESFYNGEITADGTGGNEEEYAIMRLRLCDGLCENLYKERFGKNIPLKYYKKAKLLEKGGYVALTKNGFHLTDKGFLVSNAVILNIID